MSLCVYLVENGQADRKVKELTKNVKTSVAAAPEPERLVPKKNSVLVCVCVCWKERYKELTKNVETSVAAALEPERLVPNNKKVPKKKCVCVCVCERVRKIHRGREKERTRERKRECVCVRVFSVCRCRTRTPSRHEPRSSDYMLYSVTLVVAISQKSPLTSFSMSTLKVS